MTQDSAIDGESDARGLERTRLRALFEYVSDIVTVLDSRGIIRLISPSVTHIVGYAIDEVLGRNYVDFVHPDDRAAAATSFADVVRSSGVTRPIELRYRHKNGSWLFLESVSRNALADPVLNGVVVVARDVSERRQAQQKLRLFRALLDRAGDAIEVVDPETLRYLDVNQAACDALGYSREELLSLQVQDLSVELGGAEVDRIDAQLRASGSAMFETLHRRKDGSMFPVEVHITRVELGRPYNLVLVRDLSERERTQRDLAFRNALLSTQQETALDAILVVDDHGSIVSYNGRFIELWKVPENLVKQRIDEPVLQWVAAQTAQPEAFLKRVRHLYAHRDEAESEEIALADGRVVDRYSAPVIGGGETYFGRVWYFRDVTERKRHEAEINRLQQQLLDQAVRDPLTGLHNRRYLDETMDRELVRAKRYRHPIGLVMCDLDHFKGVNDRYGHVVGDEVLKAFAGLLKSAARGSDIACRYGGEEFLLVFPDMPADAACRRAEQLRAALEGMSIATPGVQVTASFGVAGFPDDGQTADELTRAADAALYEAKRSGRNRVATHGRQAGDAHRPA